MLSHELSLVQACSLPLPGRELGRVGNVSRQDSHVEFEVAPRASEKVLAGHFSQSLLFLLPVEFRYVPAGQKSGSVMPRCGQYAPAGHSWQTLSLMAPSTAL